MENFSYLIKLRILYIENFACCWLVGLVNNSIDIIRSRILCNRRSISIINGSPFVGSSWLFGEPCWPLEPSPYQIFLPVPIMTAKLTKRQRRVWQPINSGFPHSSAVFFWRFTVTNGITDDFFFSLFHFLLRRSDIFVIQLQILEFAISFKRSERINSLTSCLASSSSVFFSSIWALTLVNSFWTCNSVGLHKHNANCQDNHCCSNRNIEGLFHTWKTFKLRLQ